MRILTRAPIEIGRREFARIEGMIAAGGEVARKRLHENLPRATAVVTAHSWGRLIGVAAIKQPTPDYVAKISTRSCFDLDAFPHEYGYLVVRLISVRALAQCYFANACALSIDQHLLQFGRTTLR